MGAISQEDQKLLLQLARSSIVNEQSGEKKLNIDLTKISPILREDGASFVTLTSLPGHQLRGCIGALEAYQPLIVDVPEHAIAAALHDYRFSPVRLAEMNRIQIEISCLTPAIRLEYTSPDDLIQKIVPGRDGVILKDGISRATFLPQVWEKIDSKEQFLSQLCQKMGARSDLWRKKLIQVYVYQVQEFHE